MEITEVRVKLMDDSDDRLQAFCSITLDDCFVVRDLKIIEGSSGPFVAMPSRKMMAHCSRCHSKNHARAAYCNQCGQKQKLNEFPPDEDGRTKLYADIAHPINTECREMIQDRVIQEYFAELEKCGRDSTIQRLDQANDRSQMSGPHHRDVPQTERESSAPSSAHPTDDIIGFGNGIF